jgi:putative sterol carrier protein
MEEKTQQQKGSQHREFALIKDLTGSGRKDVPKTFEKLMELLGASGIRGSLQLQVLEDEAGEKKSYVNVKLGAGQQKMSTRSLSKPNVELITRPATWMEIASGRLAPIEAFLQGKMRVRGIPGIPRIWAIDAQMNPFFELAGRVLPELSDMLLEANSSDNAIRWRRGLLRPASCIEPLKHCAFRSRHTRIGCTPGPSTMNLSPSETAALTAATCVSPPITEIRWAFACRGGSGTTSPMKRSKRSLMLVVVFSVLFT